MRNSEANFKNFKDKVQSGEIFASSYDWEFLPSDIDVRQFQEWYIEKGSFYTPTKCLFPFIFLKTEQNTPSLCFRNSQLLTLNNTNTLYCEGVLYGSEKDRKYHHGFNLRKDKAIDITYLKNKRVYDEEIESKTLFYHGIVIPIELIRAAQIRNHGQFEQKPLIYDYYRSIL